MESKPKRGYYSGVLTRLWFVICVLWSVGWWLLMGWMRTGDIYDYRQFWVGLLFPYVTGLVVPPVARWVSRG